MKWFKKIGESETEKAARVRRLEKRIAVVLARISEIHEDESLSSSFRVLRVDLLKFLESGQADDALTELILQVSDQLIQAESLPSEGKTLESLRNYLFLVLKRLKGTVAHTFHAKGNNRNETRFFQANNLETLRMTRASLAPVNGRPKKKWQAPGEILFGR